MCCVYECICLYVDDPNWIRPARSTPRSTEIVRLLTGGNAKACTITNIQHNNQQSSPPQPSRRVASYATSRPNWRSFFLRFFFVVFLLLVVQSEYTLTHAYIINATTAAVSTCRQRGAAAQPHSGSTITMVFGGKFRITRLDTHLTNTNSNTSPRLD